MTDLSSKLILEISVAVFSHGLDQQQDDLVRKSKVRPSNIAATPCKEEEEENPTHTAFFASFSIRRCATPQEYSCIDLSVCISIGSAVNCHPSHPPVGGRDSREGGRRGIHI